MSWKGYEFSCPDCGAGYLRRVNTPCKCPNKSCKGNYMELYAIVEAMDEYSDETMFMGLKFFLSRRLIDNSRNK